MARHFDSAYLRARVELTDEREAHIRGKHPDVFAPGDEYVRGVLDRPDVIQTDPHRPGTRQFARWYDDLRQGKYLVVVVVTDALAARHWIVTAFIARRLGRGAIEWQR